MNVSLTKACLLMVTTAAVVSGGELLAQSPGSELYTDPATGIVYQKSTRIVQQPIVDRRMEKQETTVYRPETVKETRPETKTTYMPVTEIKWKPYVRDRWNPFRQPSVAYRQVAETRWEQRTEVINRTTMQTRWVPERRTVEIPHDIVRMESRQETNYQPIARVMPQPSTGSSVDAAIASRLRPLAPGTPITADNGTRIASNTVGSATSDRPLRDSNQSGMRTNVLLPSGGPGSRMDTLQSGVGIATVPSYSIRR